MRVNTEDLFPLGMKVLVVDDDHSSLDNLKFLLLEKCKYHVTIATEATTALKLLHNGKQKVDLIIVDANMAGMDGRKLFENVASLNKSIPFILLSSNLNKEFIMEGVEYGACDFMSKPARLHELHNIWRHVVRRRNELNIRKQNNPDSAPIQSFEAPKKLPVIENVDHNRKPYGKRKDHTSEEKGKHDAPLNQKKRRLVWTQDLHRKFIAVFDKVGLENAVPKKILEIMNDESLTRENVASHLQKYRLFLKKSRQAANKITSFGSIHNIANNNSNVSHSGVTQNYSSIQLMEKQNMLYGLPTPLLEPDSVKQATSSVSDFPANWKDFGHVCTPIQSPSSKTPIYTSSSSVDHDLLYEGSVFSMTNWSEDFSLLREVNIDDKMISTLRLKNQVDATSLKELFDMVNKDDDLVTDYKISPNF